MHIYKTKTLSSLAALLAFWASTDLQAARVPAPDPLQGDGRISDFYHWKQEIPSQPGKWLRSEPLEATLGLSNAQQQYRVLFSSTDGVEGKAPIVVSGAVFIPKGQAPKSGWPVVHGAMAPLVGPISAPTPGMRAPTAMYATSTPGWSKALPWWLRIIRG
ncbi:hypothetical protein [Methylobacillus glycogenes]|uniref:hypothetical protein n=1 Tax=Methylobacillus glycogenes TaxID=406 RepID=UPI001F423470|nr:hypothetical protein [Methylobacillus glycogenes]